MTNSAMLFYSNNLQETLTCNGGKKQLFGNLKKKPLSHAESMFNA